jgi:hypothetical protein
MTDHSMEPVSGEKVEVDGVYTDEWGRQQKLQSGDVFPKDLIMGTTEWQLSELSLDNHHEGRTDPRLVPKKNDTDKQGKIDHPRRQMARGKK